MSSTVTAVKPIIEIRDLVQHFAQNRFAGKKVVHALNGVSLDIYPGETLGLVGETGCGKTTLCRAVMRLYKPTAGSVTFDGVDITDLRERKLKFVRQNMQMIFQDPADSLNSRLTVGYIIEEPMVIQTRRSADERRAATMELLETVGLPEESYHRYPHEFSGGQRQRIAIARALALNPKVIVCDEPVSALDVSVQSQVLNLLLSLQHDHNLTMIFISHDLSVVRHMSDRVVVMYLGAIMEIARSRSIYEEPLHPYTKALVAAIPKPDPTRRNERIPFTGEIPSPLDPPSGCPFRLNCPVRIDRCTTERPVPREVSEGHAVACHLVEDAG